MSLILIVDDEPVLAHQLAVALRSNGHEVLLADTAASALERTATRCPDLVLLDMRLPDRSGLELIPELRSLDPALMIVLMTAYGTDQDAIDALRLGAADYLPKPLNLGELGLVIDRLLRERHRERELSYLRAHASSTALPPECFEGPLGEVLRDVLRICDRSVPAGRRPPVVLIGEPGSGRRELAKAIHERLGGGPFLAVSCVEHEASRLAVELFGADADPDTGRASVPGLIEAAEGGTLFVDELSALPASLQQPFLEVITRGRSFRVGSDRPREVSAHIIASTRDDLASASTTLLAELIQELRSLQFEVPPLRKRPEDILRAARFFANRYGVRLDGRPRQIAEDAASVIAHAEFPHNLPELRNVIERAVQITPGEIIDAVTIKSLLERNWPEPGEFRLPSEGIRFEELERDLIRQALVHARGNRTRAASLLGLSRDAFRYRMTRLGVEPD